MTTETAQTLSDAARKLAPTERADLVDQILDSLDASDPSIDALWAKEAEDRLAAYKRGEIHTVALPEVLAKYSRS